MSAQCFIDLFDSAAFRGERRRIYGPAKLEAHFLGLQGDNNISVRVGAQAALRIEMASGENKTLHGGEQVDALNTGRIKWLEVRPSDN